MKKDFYILHKITNRISKIIFNIRSDFPYKFYHIIKSLWDKNGFQYMIKYMKVSKLHITRYICGKPLYSNADGVSLINGFPKKFIFLKENIDKAKQSNNYSMLRLIFTLLSITRGLQPTKKEDNKIKPKFDTITSPSKVNKMYFIEDKFIEDFCLKFKLYSEKPKIDLDSNYISVKGSPEGKSSWSSTWSIFGHNWTTMNYILNIIGSDSFNKLFTKHWEALYDKFGDGDFKIGKLSIVKDPECKRRVIAMVDYHSQLVLKSIHNKLMNLIHNLPCDRTFTQSPFNNWNKSKDLFWSLDLSAATDRFPIYLQERLISHIYRDDILASNWKNLLIDRDYYYNDKQPGLQQDNWIKFRYSVGQPMGAYSSWITFTLTHHLVVHWAAHLCGFKDFTFDQYILLGDDIVIKNNKVADKYKGIMMRLGVDISSSKTHVSYDTYEFAKRWIMHGVEISGLPMKGIISNWRNLLLTFSNLLDYHKKGLFSNFMHPLQVISMTYTGIHNGHRLFKYKDVYRYLYDFYFSYRYSQNSLTTTEMRQYCLSKIRETDLWSLPKDNLIPLFYKGVLSTGITEIALDTMTDLKNVKSKLIEHFPICNEYPVPIVHGIISKLKTIKMNIEKYSNDSITFVELIKLINPTDIEALSRKERDTIIVLDYLNSCFKNSFSEYLQYKEDEGLDGFLSSFVNTKFDIELEDQWSYSLFERIDEQIIEAGELCEIGSETDNIQLKPLTKG